MQSKTFALSSGHKIVCTTADGKTWQLPCQKCKGMLFGTIPLEITLQPGESERDGITRLVIGWEECNASRDLIHCQSCRESK